MLSIFFTKNPRKPISGLAIKGKTISAFFKESKTELNSVVGVMSKDLGI